MIAVLVRGMDLVIGFFADLWNVSESALCHCPYECPEHRAEYPEP